MKAFLLYVKKTVAAGFGFIVVWLSTFNVGSTTLIPVRYLPYVTLAVGLAGTYSVWKLTNGDKPIPPVSDDIPA